MDEQGAPTKLGGAARRARRERIGFALGVVLMIVGFVLISTGRGTDGGSGNLPNPAAFWIGLALFAGGASVAWFGSRPLPAQATRPRAGTVTSLADFEIPATFRNWNFAKSTVAYGAISAALLCLNVVSSWRLAWLGIGLLAAAAVSTLFSLRHGSWRSSTSSSTACD